MSTLVKRFAIAATGVLTLGTWALASAHHSAASFDFMHMITVEGTVKQFTVMNPHTHAVVVLSGDKGTRDVEYEGHSASNFYRAGYTKDAVKPGEKISILIAPRRDGRDGGFIMSFRTAAGQTIGFGGLSPASGKVEDKSAQETKPPAR